MSIMTRLFGLFTYTPEPTDEQPAEPAYSAEERLLVTALEKHRRMLAGNQRAIDTIQIESTTRIGDLKEQKAEAGRIYQRIVTELNQAIDDCERTAKRRVELRKVMARSNTAAIAPLEEAISLDDHAPAEVTQIPIMRHMDIRS